MSERINDGGPAFPAKRVEEFPLYTLEGELVEVSTHEVSYPGMTLRDYFAGQALAGAMATLGDVHSVRWAEVARDCYIAADCLLEARK